MINVCAGVRDLLATRPIDFRKGAHSLAVLAQEALAEDPFSGAVIVYRAKRSDCLKILVWDSSDLGLVWKQVRQGSFRWPPIMDGVMTGRSALQGSALARLAVDAMLADICIDLFEVLVPIKLRELYANRPP